VLADGYPAMAPRLWRYSEGRYDDLTPRQIGAERDQVTGVWGDDANALWVAQAIGAPWRWGGGGGIERLPPVDALPYAQQRMSGAGTTPWLAFRRRDQAGGSLARWTGTTWRATSVGGEIVGHIAMTPTRAWVVGSQHSSPAIWQFEGSSWFKRQGPEDAGFLGACALANGTLIIVGKAGRQDSGLLVLWRARWGGQALEIAPGERTLAKIGVTAIACGEKSAYAAAKHEIVAVDEAGWTRHAAPLPPAADGLVVEMAVSKRYLWFATRHRLWGYPRADLR
jgi:hypothetical protein